MHDDDARAATMPAQSTLPASVPASRSTGSERLAYVDARRYADRVPLARGGMGTVTRVQDRRLARTVALKELRVQSPELRARFEREALLTARLQHPSIVTILEAGRWPSGEPFYAMRLVPGRSLDRVIAEARTLDQRLALLPRVLAVADALAYAHQQRVIHRDLKPQNVLVGEFGETVVIDWGLAKDLAAREKPFASGSAAGSAAGSDGIATVAGDVLGTPAYMPPEQANGLPVDERADVYAIGAVLYHTLAGVAPYTGSSAVEILADVVAEPPLALASRQPGLPPDLLAIVARAMDRDPAARYPTARELADDLRRFQTGQLVGSHRYSAGQLVRRWIRKHRAPLSVVAIAAVVMVVLGVAGIRRIIAGEQLAGRERAAALDSRANAERWMDFMLDDLRSKLQKVGKMELLDLVAQQARDYYASRGSDGSIADLARRSQTHHNIGEVLRERGNLPAAMGEFRTALVLRASVVAIDPSIDALRRLHDTHNRIGDVTFEQGDSIAALGSFQAALDLARQVAARKPGDLMLARDIAQSDQKVGDNLFEQGRVSEALALYREGRDIMQRVFAADPTKLEWRLGLAVMQENVADGLRTQGKLVEALAEQRASHAHSIALLAAEPDDIGNVRSLSISYSKIGNLLLALGQPRPALDAHRESLALSTRVADVDPEQPDLQRGVAICNDRVGNAQLALGDLAAALASYRAALTVREKVVATARVPIGWTFDLVGSYDRVGDVLMKQGKGAEALGTYSAGAKLAEQLVAKDGSNAVWSLARHESISNRSDALLAIGATAAAAEELRKASAITDALLARDGSNADAHAAAKRAQDKLAVIEAKLRRQYISARTGGRRAARGAR